MSFSDHTPTHAHTHPHTCVFLLLDYFCTVLSLIAHTRHSDVLLAYTNCDVQNLNTKQTHTNYFQLFYHKYHIIVICSKLAKWGTIFWFASCISYTFKHTQTTYG